MDQQRAFLRLAYDVLVVDGVMHPNEELLLNEFRREMSLVDAAPVSYIDLPGLEAVFDGKRARAIVVLNLLNLSYADGAFEIEEECLLRQVAKQFEIGDGQFMLMDNWVRRLMALEQEARTFF